MILFTESYPQTVNLNFARIGYQTYTRDSVVSASTNATGSIVTAPANGFTYEHWSPSVLPGWWKIDAGGPVTVNYCGIVGGLAGIECTVQYSNDNSTWLDAGEITPQTNAPVMILFELIAARYWRVLFDNEKPKINVIYFGEVLEMQRGLYGGHSPITLSRSTQIRPNVSNKGQWLGRSIIRNSLNTSFSWKNLTADWYRENFDLFVLSARRYPFFIAWRPHEYPEEIGYCWTQNDIIPSNTGVKDFMQVSVDVSGIGYEQPAQTTQETT